MEDSQSERDTEIKVRISVPLGLPVLEKEGPHGRGECEFTLEPCFYPGEATQYKRENSL